MDRREQSFTLIELMIVVVIIGVIAGFAIPGYQKAIEKNEERVAHVKLRAIGAGMKIYNAKHGDYPNVDMPNLASINQTLGLNIVPDSMTYTCYQVSGSDLDVCKALHPKPNDWRIHWHPLLGAGGGGPDTIHCHTGPACPSCPFAPGNCD